MRSLEGPQYVQLAPGAAQAIAPYLDLDPGEIGELVLDVDDWPDQIRPSPRIARDGRLIAGDPVLVGAEPLGLLIASGPRPAGESGPVLIAWHRIRVLEALPPYPLPAGV
jgi:hypothetical protein